MYFFILEIQIPSKSEDFPGTRFLSSLFFPGMEISHSLQGNKHFFFPGVITLIIVYHCKPN